MPEGLKGAVGRPKPLGNAARNVKIELPCVGVLKKAMRGSGVKRSHEVHCVGPAAQHRRNPDAGIGSGIRADFGELQARALQALPAPEGVFSCLRQMCQQRTFHACRTRRFANLVGVGAVRY